jgi:hypothetical protein
MTVMGGIRVQVVRSKYGSNDGPDQYTLIHPDLEGPSEPTHHAPALVLNLRVIGGDPILSAEPVSCPGDRLKMVGPMMGGNFVHTSDSRVSDLVRKLLGHRFYGAIALHDRWETQAQYDSLSS